MKRRIAIIASIIIALVFLYWLVTWINNGGWPSSGPVGASLPPHIQFVAPADGESVLDSYGFCVHFNYQTGRGIGDEPKNVIRYFFNGTNVTRDLYDVSTTEYGYPDPVGEPCYNRAEPLKPGWHTVKVTYKDISGESFEYKWRFYVVEED